MNKTEAETIATTALAAVDLAGQKEFKSIFKAFDKFRLATSAVLIKSKPSRALTEKRARAARRFKVLLDKFNSKYKSDVTVDVIFHAIEIMRGK